MFLWLYLRSFTETTKPSRLILPCNHVSLNAAFNKLSNNVWLGLNKPISSRVLNFASTFTEHSLKILSLQIKPHIPHQRCVLLRHLCFHVDCVTANWTMVVIPTSIAATFKTPYSKVQPTAIASNRKLLYCHLRLFNPNSLYLQW